jgi:iron(III) transport system substrate-binding protein
MSRRSLRHQWAIGALLILLAAAAAWPTVARGQAAGAGVQERLDELAKLSGDERQRFLEAQALKEGKVVMYAADDPNLIRAWNTEFKKKYPQIDAQFIRMTTREMLQRSMNESRAGHPVADLLHPPAVELAVLQQQNAIARYASPEARELAAEFKDPEGFWTMHWFAPQVVGFNTSVVKRENVPVTLEGLTDPALKGKLGRIALGGRWVAGVLKAKGEKDGMELIRRIAAQEPRLYESNTALVNALTSGQISIAFDANLSNVAVVKQRGAPIDYVVPDPLFLLPVYQVVMKDAPHPFAAALAYDWILSKQGQAVYKDLDQMGPRKDTEYPGSDVVSKAKTTISLSPTLLADPARFNKIFDDLFVRK